MLTLYQDYSRKDVHDIFDLYSPFIPQRGSWGLHGIIALPDRAKDFVFFVTYGKSQGDFDFDESITEDGVLSWQSQPSQGFSDRRIQQFINHDSSKNVIYLFLRTHRDKKYTYLGPLEYLAHDVERENPVHFEWQIIEGAPPSDVCKKMGLELVTSRSASLMQQVMPSSYPVDSGLSLETAPLGVRISSRKKSELEFKTYKNPDYAARDKRNRNLGRSGEELVWEHEVQSLIKANRKDLAERVVHTSLVEGDGAGYDILSYHIDGRKKFIEVKTTKGISDTDFFLSPNEIEFSRLHADNYYLYRVYEFNEATNSANFYILEGDISKQLNLVPQNYRAKIKG